MAPFYTGVSTSLRSVRVSRHAQYQDTKWTSAIKRYYFHLGFLIYRLFIAGVCAHVCVSVRVYVGRMVGGFGTTKKRRHDGGRWEDILRFHRKDACGLDKKYMCLKSETDCFYSSRVCVCLCVIVRLCYTHNRAKKCDVHIFGIGRVCE